MFFFEDYVRGEVMIKRSLSKIQLLFLFILLLSFFIYYRYYYVYPVYFKEMVYADFGGYPEEKELLYSFIEEHFLENGFFRTNLLDSPQRKEASGEDVLSESIGLLMLYYLKEDSPLSFERQVNIVKDYFLNENQLIQWRIRPGEFNTTVSAPIDDLRIIKALIKASEKWHREDYLIFAQDLSFHLMYYAVKDHNLLAYDSKNSPKAPFVYYDFKALQLMVQFHDDWYEILKKNAETIAHYKVPGRPFYIDRWFYHGREFPMIENLMILMHFGEVGVLCSASLLWLKDEMDHHGLFGLYNRKGEPLNNLESPAVYALVAIIAKLYEDEELYHQAIEHLRRMQILENTKYCGGFVNLSTLSSFSFDHLLSLLAY